MVQKLRFLLTGLFCVLLNIIASPQIILRSIPNYTVNDQQLNYLENSGVRSRILLDGQWQVYVEKDKDKNKVPAAVPSIFEGKEALVFEKSVMLRKETINGKVLYLNILGMNYSGEIALNNYVIYKYQGGAVPFMVQLPKDLLKADKNNLISIHVRAAVNEKNSIPLKNQFLFPHEYPGIFRDVFIAVVPEASISRYSINTTSIKGDRAQIKVRYTANNGAYTAVKDVSVQSDYFEVKVSVESAGGQIIGSNAQQVEIKKGKLKEGALTIDVSGAPLWTPENPVNCRVRFQVISNGSIVDDFSRSYGINTLFASKDGMFLNNSSYQLRGATYVPIYKNYGGMLSYAQMRRDMMFIKETGFNAVRFEKAAPHPYLLALCQELGLLAFVDMPLDGVPSSWLTDNVFLSASKTYLNQYIAAYGNYSCVAGFGLGSSYIGSDERDDFYLGQLADEVHSQITKIVYASFSGSHIIGEIAGIDLYGLEFLNKNISEVEAVRSAVEAKVGKGRVILSSVGYLATEGISNGYLNDYSFEAQAKLYSDLLDLADSQNLPGYFVNSIFDYRTSYISLLGRYNSEGILPIGISGEERETSRTGFKVLSAGLHNLQKVTVPIGVKKDRSPLVFIIFGMALALLVGFLINSGRKFREDATRALVRPYNFFADVRDMRIFSVGQSFMLSIIVSAIMALLTESFLYYFRDSILLERLLLSYSSNWLMKFVGYLTWHPTSGIFILTAVIFVKILVISGVIKLFSYSVMNKVYYTSAFYITAWSFIPLLLMIPVGIILYRVLVPNVANAYIYIFFIAFAIWMLMRILKGTHVIFDVIPGKVYFFGFVFIVGVLLVLFGYLQMNYMTVDYIFQAIREFKTGI